MDILAYILATNVRHDGHQSYRSYICTLPTHVAPCDDLKSCLLSRVHVVWNEFGLHNLLLDWVTSLLDG
jgi:hypothetical protein